MGLRHGFERVQEKSGIVPGLPVLPHGWKDMLFPVEAVVV